MSSKDQPSLLTRTKTPALLEYFADLPDPRIERFKHHELIDLIAIVILAMICAKFRGKLSDDKQKIEGTFSQACGHMPCSLERKGDPAAVAKESLAGFDDAVTDAMEKFEVPGMAIAIIKGKEVVYAKGFGHRDVEKQLPVTVDTLFAIGSSPKAFASFGLGTLVDEGKVEWDKPVRNYITWFKLYDPAMTERLSVRDLVTHRSGLPRHDLVWYNNFDASRQS